MADAMCHAGELWCPQPATAYVFGGGERLTFVTGERARELTALTPTGARCAGHAVWDLEGLLCAAAVEEA